MEEKTEKTVTISLLIPEKINELLEHVVLARGEDKSSFIRRSIYTELARLSFLPEETKKALGININNNNDKACLG
jgi:thymidylate synthase ThyX